MYDRRQVAAMIDRWLEEDVGHGDLTTEIMIPASAEGEFVLNAREPMTVAGLEVAGMVFQRLDHRIDVAPQAEDGDPVPAGSELAWISGPARPILTAERTALNIVQRLSGIATLTAAYAERIKDTGAMLVDTRKTTPGLRMLEKHAVTCGGGRNHRMGLDGGVMLKDNHIAIAGGIREAVARAQTHAPLLTKIEVECDRLDQVREALMANADVIMLDNMSNASMRKAVGLIDGRAIVECSGGVTLETVRDKALTGVDAISVGRLTQSAPAVDIGLDAAPSRER